MTTPGDDLPTGRLPLLPQHELEAAAARIGMDPKYLSQRIWQVLFARPKLTKPIYELLTDLLFRGSIDPRLRELIIMRIGWATGSVFEWTQHWKIAMNLGLAAEDILAVRDWRRSARLDERDRAVLGATDTVMTEGFITAERWEALRPHFDDGQLLEVTSVIATWYFISILLKSLDVPLDEGMAPWPPDGVRPSPAES